MKPARIVVGTDGSPGAMAAVRWAAGTARSCGRPLSVLCAYHWRVSGTRFDATDQLAEVVRERAGAAVAAAVAEARRIAPDVEVDGSAVLGEPAPVLLRAAAEANLLVVGNRGRGGFADLLLGSVGVHVATHAAGPVVIVRGRADARTGPVVVGVDGSTSADAAAGLGFELAAGWRCPVLLVEACPDALPAWSLGAPPVGYDLASVREELQEYLARQVRGWSVKYPQTPVDGAVIGGAAGAVLAEQSRHARLVVVGSRGHGGFAGLLLGSVGQQLLHHADCPVLIARGR